jgi:hypothetical protein
MSSLTDFLKEQAQRFAQPDLKKELDQWIQSEQKLIRLLKQWLEGADSGQVLKVIGENHELREEKFGSYSAVHRLTIHLGGRRVEVVPRGGAVGGIVLLEDGQSAPIRGLVEMKNDIDRYRLYRIIGDSGEQWYIKHDRAERAKPLNQTNFEAAMVHLLK